MYEKVSLKCAEKSGTILRFLNIYEGDTIVTTYRFVNNNIYVQIKVDISTVQGGIDMSRECASRLECRHQVWQKYEIIYTHNNAIEDFSNKIIIVPVDGLEPLTDWASAGAVITTFGVLIFAWPVREGIFA